MPKNIHNAADVAALKAGHRDNPWIVVQVGARPGYRYGDVLQGLGTKNAADRATTKLRQEGHNVTPMRVLDLYDPEPAAPAPAPLPTLALNIDNPRDAEVIALGPTPYAVVQQDGGVVGCYAYRHNADEAAQRPGLRVVLATPTVAGATELHQKATMRCIGADRMVQEAQQKVIYANGQLMAHMLTVQASKAAPNVAMATEWAAKLASAATSYAECLADQVAAGQAKGQAVMMLDAAKDAEAHGRPMKAGTLVAHTPAL